MSVRAPGENYSKGAFSLDAYSLAKSKGRAINIVKRSCKAYEHQKRHNQASAGLTGRASWRPKQHRHIHVLDDGVQKSDLLQLDTELQPITKTNPGVFSGDRRLIKAVIAFAELSAYEKQIIIMGLNTKDYKNGSQEIGLLCKGKQSELSLA